MLESVMIGRANIARMNCRFCVSRLSDSACRRSMEQSKFLFSLPPSSLWYSRYHNVPPRSLIYADKRILSGVKIQEVGLCSSFSQQRHYSEVYEKLVPTRQRPGAKKNFRLLLPSMDARPNPLGSCDIISLAGSTDYGCSVYGFFSNILHISKCFC